MRWPHSERRLTPLRGNRTPREGAGPLPAPLLEIWAGQPTNYLPPSRHIPPKKLRGEGVRDMFTKLADTNKAAIFSVLVLCMSVGAALLIRMLGLSVGFGLFTVWSFTPTVATLIMLLVVTREGYSRKGWKSLGLHRLGLNVWWIAFGATLLITVAASAVVWATPLASFVMPEGGFINAIINFLIGFGIGVFLLALAEEIGMRGYLQPRLMSLGRNRALLVVGLVWATWHMPLIFLTPFYHAAGNK